MTIKVCGTCGTDKIHRNAFIEWCLVNQTWVIDEFKEDGDWCQDCESTTEILDNDEMLTNVINERENDDLTPERAAELDELYLILQLNNGQ